MENSFYVLLAVLVPLSLLVFILTEYDILNPICIVTCLMTFSVFLATTKIDRWHLYMSVDASLLIISSLSCFILSGLWADWKIKKNIGGIPVIKENCVYSISNTGILLMSLIILLLGYFQYREFYDSSVMLGNRAGPFDFSSMIKAIRPSIERETFRFSRWNAYRRVVSEIMVDCCIFLFYIRSITRKEGFCFVKNLKYLFPFFAFFPFFACSTDRMSLLGFLLFVMFSGSIIFQIKRDFSLKSKVNSIIFFIAFGVTFFVLFLAFGMLSGKVSIGGRSPYEILVHYGGVSMPAFSIFLEHVRIESPYIGSFTLGGIYGNLNRLGAELPPVKYFLPFVHFNDINTNVYTLLARYINDYGFIGMHLIMSFLGMFYVMFYDYVRVISKKYDLIIVYSLLLFPLFFATNDEYFLKNILTTTTIYELICIYLVFLFFVKKHNI